MGYSGQTTHTFDVGFDQSIFTSLEQHPNYNLYTIFIESVRYGTQFILVDMPEFQNMQ